MLWGKGFGGVILLVVSTSICCSLLFTQATAGLEMSWRCSGRTNAELVNNLFRNGIIKNERVKDAMLAVDRGDFVGSQPYADSPQPIGIAATISAPHMHAYAMELLEHKLQPGSRVLDVGSGSGYLAVAFAKLVVPNGRVHGIEHIQELVDKGILNTKKNNADLLESGVVKFSKRDGFQGVPEDAPFDAIHVGAAAEELPSKLVEQLAPDGEMIIPLGPPGGQSLVRVTKKSNGEVVKKNLMGVSYVPLTSEKKQRGTF